MTRIKHAGAVGALCLLLGGCAVPPSGTGPQTSLPTPEPTRRTTAVEALPTPPGSPSPIPSPSGPPAASLVGDTRNAWAYAPLDQPDRLVVEGSVPNQRAWSTSKVLVLAAFLAEACDGDPERATALQHRQMVLALRESDMDAVVAIGEAIPGGKQDGMTKVLRSIGDLQTTVPSRLEGTMLWTIREQVRFLLALDDGRVVSPKVSRYLLNHMHPVESQSWGLGSAGASAFKGGWLRAGTETRQMGIMDGYAVAVITAGVGPVELQSDGDSAHVQQVNVLAEQLHQRLADPS